MPRAMRGVLLVWSIRRIQRPSGDAELTLHAPSPSKCRDPGAAEYAGAETLVDHTPLCKPIADTETPSVSSSSCTLYVNVKL